jgi:hypothetical protein
MSFSAPAKELEGQGTGIEEMQQYAAAESRKQEEERRQEAMNDALIIELG